MNDAGRAEALAQLLALRPHPEGGAYAELFRSTATVHPADGRPARPGLTTIYFLLREGERSRWHVVRSDEAWHWIEGAPLELATWAPGEAAMSVTTLGQVDADGMRPVHVVPAGAWQAARSTGAYTLVACDVGPGFDFADFALADLPEQRAALAALGAASAAYL